MPVTAILVLATAILVLATAILLSATAILLSATAILLSATAILLSATLISGTAILKTRTLARTYATVALGTPSRSRSSSLGKEKLQNSRVRDCAVTLAQTLAL